ncbi:MAG: UDP-N-acetylmuramoyl-tripeptide--D-alanyl-D-alanine ligase [Thermoleophilia bacterium]
MIPLTLAAVPASVVMRGDPEALVTGVTIDSRAAGQGDLFIAIRGGIDFIESAIENGALAVVVEEEEIERAMATDIPNILMTFSSMRCLQFLGDATASASAATRIGVTGSTGKTSTKDAIAHLVGGQRRTVAALEGHNNELGYPLTLTHLEPDTEVIVCELAMRGKGQIAELCALAAPDIGVITNVGVAHIELLGSQEAIAEAKAEIANGLREGGTAVIPFAEPLLDPFLPADIAIVTFGDEAGADVQLVDRRIDPTGQDLTYLVHGELLSLRTNLVGRHHARNLAAALAVCAVLGLDLADVAARAAAIPQQRWRGESVVLPGGVEVVNDAYNANPASMEAALRLLSELPAEGRRIAVLGLMAELGTDTERYHRDVGALAARSGVDIVIAVGDFARAYLDGAGSGVHGHWVATPDAAVDRLAELVRSGDRVLVKGSRSAGLEAIPDLLAERLEARA